MIRTMTKELKFWADHIDAYERDYGKWETRSKKIIKRYKDERPENDKTSQFNILWSNVQTLSPALYASPPKPNIDRRYQDNDDLGLTVSRVLERAASYYVQHDDFDDVMRQSVLDRLLPGRGVAWVRYCPDFGDKSQITDDVALELYGEDVVVDYVHWRDFGHTVAKTWQEVRAVWRAVGMEQEDLKKRFPEKWDKIPLDTKPEGESKEASSKKATIYEIWDKKKREVIWLHKDMEDVLDSKPDPLRLKNFFPCPKPIYATITNESLVPIPDYVLYQDQAREMDMLTARIGLIVQALKVAGVYDSSAQGVQKLLENNSENQLIPVENWAVFGEKGGLNGVVDWFPVEQLIQVVTSLYDARDQAKQVLYEITGISDIIRGATNASETATAQQIKGQYATLRLDHMQKDVARFARDLVRIITEIIAEHFSMDTIKQVSGIRLMTEQEKQMAQQQLQMAQAQAQQTQQPPPPVPEEIEEMLALPTWEQVEQLIRDDMARCFRIDIETDSTIKTDQEAEKQARTEFLTAAGSFIQQAAQVPNPELAPLLMEMLMFGVRGFKVGRDMETTFETTLAKIKKQSEQPPPPNPEMEAQKQEAALKEKELQHKDKELQFKDKELAFKETEANLNHDIETKRMVSDKEVARISAKSAMKEEDAAADPDMHDGPTPIEQLITAMTQGFAQMAQMQIDGNQAVIKAVSAPRVLDVKRDNGGRMQGAVSRVVN